MTTTYFKVTTANSTYYVRHIDNRTGDPLRDAHPNRLPNVTDVWGAGRFFTLAQPGRPRTGEPMIGTDAAGRIRTSPVRAVHRISFRTFADAKL